MAGQNLTAQSFPLLARVVDLLEGNGRIQGGCRRPAVLHQARAGKEVALGASATCRMKCGTSTSAVVFLCGTECSKI